MADDTVSVSPPYSTYKQFLNVISGLRDTKVPSRIDRSLFGNMSGGTAYSLLSTLKFLKLIDNDGAPQPLLRQLVTVDESERKPLIHQMLQAAYPTLLDGPLNLAEASGGQFDEHLRQEFNVKGSTVDKVAAFFLAAAEDAGLALSAHLKKRKPAGSGSVSRRRSNGRKEGTSDAPAQHNAPRQRSLSHVLTDLLDVTDMSDVEMEAVWTLLRYQKRKEAEAARAAAEAPKE